MSEEKSTPPHASVDEAVARVTQAASTIRITFERRVALENNLQDARNHVAALEEMVAQASAAEASALREYESAIQALRSGTQPGQN